MGHSLASNTLGQCGLLLLCVPIIAWIYIFHSQFRHMTAHQQRDQLAKPKTYRLHVLLVRTALFLPFYAIFIFISLMEPSYFEGLQPLFAVVEGYSFYCMFAMIVANLGGPSAAVKMMQTHPEELPCCSWCPQSPPVFYNRVVSGLKYFLFLRVPCIIIGTVTYYAGMKVINVVMTLVTLGLLINGLVGIVTFYENVMHVGLSHFSKVISLKISIGLIVFQGIIEMFMELGGVFDGLVANPGYSAENTLTRYYCFLILVEYVFFSAAVANFFSGDINYLGFADPQQSSSSIDLAASDTLSPLEFMGDVLAVHDVFTTYSVSISDAESRALNDSGPGSRSIELFGL